MKSAEKIHLLKIDVDDRPSDPSDKTESPTQTQEDGKTGGRVGAGGGFESG